MKGKKPSIKAFMGGIGPNGLDFHKMFDSDEQDKDHDDSVHAHYGVSEKQYDTWVREMFIDNVKFNLKTRVIDNAFPELSNEQRCKIYAYNHAMHAHHHAKINGIVSEDEEYADDENTQPVP